MCGLKYQSIFEPSFSLGGILHHLNVHKKQWSEFQTERQKANSASSYPMQLKLGSISTHTRNLGGKVGDLGRV